MDPADMISISAESRNQTEDDLPGPGRLLGKLYASLGRKLESAMGSVAYSMGKGPAQKAERVWNLKRIQDLQDLSARDFSVLMKNLNKNCQALLKYTRYAA